MNWFQKAKSTPQKLRCIDIVQAYGAVLEEEPFGAGGTICEDKLPFDKSIIKAAIVDVATTQGIGDDQKKMLHEGFLQLATFRPNGGGVSALSKVSGSQPTTREEVAAFFEGYGKNNESELAGSVAEEMKILNEEWTVRIKLSEVMR